MTRKPSLDNNKISIEFGAYAQVFEDNNVANTTKARTTGAIALNLTGNEQGWYFFMYLETGQRLSRQQWNKVPIPEGVIAKVKAMAIEKKQLTVKDEMNFEWAPGIPIDDRHTEVNIHQLDEVIKMRQKLNKTLSPSTTNKKKRVMMMRTPAMIATIQVTSQEVPN